MDDLSLHILDVAENSVTAGATVVEITVDENPAQNSLRLSITDDGKGMDEATVKAAMDPFMTTKQKAKSVGLGLPFLAESSQAAGGDLKVESIPGAGTRVTATMDYDNIDRRPLGDLAATIITLVVGYPEVEFRYVHTVGKRQFVFTTWELKEKINHTGLSSAVALRALKETLALGEAGLR
jgi:anti-sigma regulatory factor (Ser/Thr protein kinase)